VAKGARAAFGLFKVETCDVRLAAGADAALPPLAIG
jgi:hypothetical protein